MSDSRSLYEKMILDHYKNPRNYGKIQAADKIVEAVNPLCGDTFTLYIMFNDDRINALQFTGSGCAISKASASLMTELLTGKSRHEANKIADAFQEMLRTEPDAPIAEEELGMLAAFAGVREFPIRIKCATLAWRALIRCFDDEKEGGDVAATD